MNRLSKSELIAAISVASGQPKTVVSDVVDRLGRLIGAAVLEADAKVVLPGLGTFAPKHRKARIGRNPATGAEIDIPATTVIGFKPSNRRA